MSLPPSFSLAGTGSVIGEADGEELDLGPCVFSSVMRKKIIVWTA